MRSLKRFASTIAVTLALTGCATFPNSMNKPVSVAISAAQTTSLGMIAVASSKDPSLSGIRLLASGQEAFASLIALADHAERTIDIQQYIIEQDGSAQVLLRHVRAAADRGVRVRILVDDLNTVGADERLMRLNQDKNIEVRVFNPFLGGRLSFTTRFIFSAREIPRINHRMHNKLFVADGAIAITGGRNIGDHYFVRDKSSNFVDLDVIAAGPVVPQLSASFDAFWNSPFAYPITAVVAAAVERSAVAVHDEPAVAPDADFLEKEIVSGKLELLWVPAAVLADQPAKIGGEENPQETETIADSVSALMRTAKEEVTVISPYFVPGNSGVALMRELIARGVQVRVLTNSLATTDSRLVHRGYARYRVELLRAGVHLNEMRPLLGQKKIRFHPFKTSRASLHAKSIVIDHRTVFIGSMNMDMRSARTNSELGLVIRSGALARQVETLFDDVQTDGSYSVRLAKDGRDIEWVSGEGPAQLIWTKEPETSVFRRLSFKLSAPFALDDLL